MFNGAHGAAAKYWSFYDLICKNKLNWNLAGNEVRHTNRSILLVKNLLCSKLHCQKEINLILFSDKLKVVEIKGLREIQVLQAHHTVDFGGFVGLTVT